MKKLHYLLWSIAIVCGLTTVQSCTMDYTEPAGVTALREATAELISAQAAVERAEASVKEAQVAQEAAIAAGLLIENQLAEIDLAKAEIELAIKELELEEATADTELYLAENQAAIEALEREQELLLVKYEEDMLDAQAALLYAQGDYETALSDLAITLSDIESDQLTELNQIIAAISANRSSYYDAVSELIGLNLDYLELNNYTYDSSTYEATLEWDITKQEYVILGYENLIANYTAYNGISYTDTSSLTDISTNLAALVKEYNTYFSSYTAIANQLEIRQMEETDFEEANTKAEGDLTDANDKVLADLKEANDDAEKIMEDSIAAAHIAVYTQAVSNEFKLATADTDVIKSLISGLTTSVITKDSLKKYGVVYVEDTPAASQLGDTTLPTGAFTITSDNKVTEDLLAKANVSLQKVKLYSFNEAVRELYASTIHTQSVNSSDETLAETYAKFIASDKATTESNEAQLAIYKENYESALATFTAAETTFKAAYDAYKSSDYAWITAKITAYNDVREAYRTEAMQQQLAADIITYAKARIAVDGWAAVRTIAAVYDTVDPSIVVTPESYVYWYESLATTSGWQELFNQTTTTTGYDLNGDPITTTTIETTLNSTYETIIGSSATLYYDKLTGPADPTDGKFDYADSKDKTYSEYAYGAYYWAYNALYNASIVATGDVVTYATTYTLEEVCDNTALVSSSSVFYTYADALNKITVINDVDLAIELNSLYALTSKAYIDIKAEYDALEATATSDSEKLTAFVEANTETEDALKKANTEAEEALKEANEAAEEAMANTEDVGSVALQASLDLIKIFVGVPTEEIYTEMASTTASNDIYKIALSKTLVSSDGTLCAEINQLINIYNAVVTTANDVNYDAEILAVTETLLDAKVTLSDLQYQLAFVQAGGYVDGSEYLAVKIAEAEAAISKKEAEIADLQEVYELLLTQKSTFLSSIE
ncbi:MAG: hypothetical protein SNJ33_04750 [Rikenellaceae bacterium]